MARVPLVAGLAVPVSALTTIYGCCQNGATKPAIILIILLDGSETPLVICTTGQGFVSTVSTSSSAFSLSDTLAARKLSGMAASEAMAALSTFTVARVATVLATANSKRPARGNAPASAAAAFAAAAAAAATAAAAAPAARAATAASAGAVKGAKAVVAMRAPPPRSRAAVSLTKPQVLAEAKQLQLTRKMIVRDTQYLDANKVEAWIKVLNVDCTSVEPGGKASTKKRGLLATALGLTAQETPNFKRGKTSESALDVSGASAEHAEQAESAVTKLQKVCEMQALQIAALMKQIPVALPPQVQQQLVAPSLSTLCRAQPSYSLADERSTGGGSITNNFAPGSITINFGPPPPQMHAAAHASASLPSGHLATSSLPGGSQPALALLQQLFGLSGGRM